MLDVPRKNKNGFNKFISQFSISNSFENLNNENNEKSNNLAFKQNNFLLEDKNMVK